MFSYFGNRTQDMAYTAGKASFARRQAASHMATVLQSYIDGREKLYAVRFAVDEIRALFGPSAALALDLVARALALDPDQYGARHVLVTEAVQLIERQMRGDFD